MTASPFAFRVTQGLERKGLTLRGLCRAARLDPSFFSKVLSGKRSPPMEEEVLRRIAAILGLDAAELIVSAGRIPEEWRALRSNSDLFRRMDALATEKSIKPEEVQKNAEIPLPERERIKVRVNPHPALSFSRRGKSLELGTWNSKSDLAEELL